MLFRSVGAGTNQERILLEWQAKLKKEGKTLNIKRYASKNSTYLALTGHYHPQKSANPPPRPTDFPTLGAVLSRVRPSAVLPYTAVHVNGPALVPEQAAHQGISYAKLCRWMVEDASCDR